MSEARDPAGNVDHWQLAQGAAELLLAAWRDPGRVVPALPEALRPRTENQAYAIQQATMAGLGRIGGWKVGAASPEADRFTCAPLPQANMHGGRAHLPAGPGDLFVEPEIAVRLGRDLEARDLPYGRDEVLDAIESVHPAIEVLGLRLGQDATDPLSQLADMAGHAALAVGAGASGWRSLDLAREEVRLLVDGTEQARATGNPGGEMIRMVVWLANVGARWAGGLRVGQVVTTGSWAGKTALRPGQAARAVFAHVGTVELGVAARRAGLLEPK